MFGKRKQEEKRIGKIETIIGPDSEVKGTVFSKGSIRVDGIIEGGITQSDSVIVGETGIVSGDINAQTVVVAGRVQGNVNASVSIELMDDAELKGDIKTRQLSIHEGAFFEGNCTMVKKEPELMEEEASNS